MWVEPQPPDQQSDVHPTEPPRPAERPSWILFFDLQVTLMLPSFESIGLSVQEKKRKIDFQDGVHGGRHGYLIRLILAIFYLQVTPMLPTKFRVSWPFGSGAEAKI